MISDTLHDLLIIHRQPASILILYEEVRVPPFQPMSSKSPATTPSGTIAKYLDIVKMEWLELSTLHLLVTKRCKCLEDSIPNDGICTVLCLIASDVLLAKPS